jgi:hypothetical protein
MRKFWVLVNSIFFALSALAAGGSSRAKADEIVDRYMNATERQQTQLRGISMEVEIEAKLPKLKKQGRLHGLRNISKLGQITYRAVTFLGDRTIKNDVIARYLTAETHATDGDTADLAISPRNYKFKYKGVFERNGRSVHVFEVAPEKKRVGLFKGQLWVDARTYLPVREAGRMVKNPSIFLKKIEFVRDYEIRDGVAYPRHIESMVQTRLVGSAELSISYTNIAKDDGAPVTTATSADTQ